MMSCCNKSTLSGGSTTGKIVYVIIILLLLGAIATLTYFIITGLLHYENDCTKCRFTPNCTELGENRVFWIRTGATKDDDFDYNGSLNYCTENGGLVANVNDLREALGEGFIYDYKGWLDEQYTCSGVGNTGDTCVRESNTKLLFGTFCIGPALPDDTTGVRKFVDLPKK